MNRIPRIAALLLCATLAAPAVIQADDAATAKGKWTVAGKLVELRHARGFREPEPFGSGTSPCLLLSNLPVPDAAVPADDEGVSELLDLSDHIRELILDRRPASEIKRAAKEEGMTFLRESALEMVLRGVTTLREINKVTFVD